VKVDMRPIRQDEIEQAKLLVPVGYAEPSWANTFVLENEGVLVGLVGIEQWVVAEPLYLSPNAWKQTGCLTVALGWLDGLMRGLCGSLGLQEWKAFITDEHAVFQRVIEKHMPVSWAREKPGKWYTRSFSYGQVEKPKAS
jgi:hypothetical protein